MIPSEEEEQREAARYLDLLGLTWFHPANGGFRHKATAGRLKAQGVKAGVPDIIILSPAPVNPRAKGIAIELKRVKGGTLSPEQKRWMSDLSDLGWIVHRCNGSGEVVDFLNSLGFRQIKIRKEFEI